MGQWRNGEEEDERGSECGKGNVVGERTGTCTVPTMTESREHENQGEGI